MGDHWLHFAPDYLTAEGLRVRLWAGWGERARSSGGFDQLLGIVAHHTTGENTLEDDAGWCWHNSPDRPIGNWLLARDGEWVMGAAGASNTNGQGGPRIVSQVVVPENNANRTCPAIEAQNNGIGEPWPAVQVDAYVRGVAAIIKGINAETPFHLEAGDVFSHSEWAPTRKFDPAGPCRFAPGGGTWHHAVHGVGITGMDLFRGEIFAELLPAPLEEDEFMAMTAEERQKFIDDIANAVWAKEIDTTTKAAGIDPKPARFYQQRGYLAVLRLEEKVARVLKHLRVEG